MPGAQVSKAYRMRRLNSVPFLLPGAESRLPELNQILGSHRLCH